MKRHWKLIIAVVGVLVLAGLGIGLAVGLSGPSPSHATTAAAAPQLTQPQQVRLEQGITAPTVTAEASVVAVEVRSEFEQQGKPLLPAGSHLSIDATTFHALSAQLATWMRQLPDRAPAAGNSYWSMRMANGCCSARGSCHEPLSARRSACLVIPVVLAILAWTAVLPAAASTAGTFSSPTPCPHISPKLQLGTTTPVLLVHGFNEGPGVFTTGSPSLKSAISHALGSSVTLVTFDYSERTPNG